MEPAGPSRENSGNNSGPAIAVKEARCPDCGSLDVDLSNGSPLAVGVKCWDCGRVYRLEESAHT